MIFKKVKSIKGELSVPGDKSISHRAVMLGSLANGTTEVENFLNGADCLSSIACFRAMGVGIKYKKTSVTIKGLGLHGLKKPSETLNTGNSGTTTRLLSGILAPQNFETFLTGDESIQKRPMKRIMIPLTEMGAQIESIHGNGCAPLHVTGKPLKAIHYQSPVASAQVKSCILFAGMYANGITSVTEPYVSRNHTEIMVNYFGGNVNNIGTTAKISPEPVLHGRKVSVPGDISSAAYFICAALIVPNSELLIKNVGINQTRDGILKVIKMMGAEIQLQNINQQDGEPSADLFIRSASLHSCEIGGELIPSLIDELPVIAVLAAYAKGQTIIKDAQELKVKESNRIDSVVQNLIKMGADVTSTNDGMIINGGKPLHGAVIDTCMDHRIAMSFAVAALQADGETTITGSDCVTISYPGFYKDLERICE